MKYTKEERQAAKLLDELLSAKKTAKIKFTHSNQLVAYITLAQKYAKNSYAHTRFDVLIALAHHVNMKTKSCFPSIARIAALCCVSERTVMRVLKEFTNSGLIKSTARYNSSSIRAFDLSKLTISIAPLTKFYKSSGSKEDAAENIDSQYKEFVQAIQKAAFKRGIEHEIRKNRNRQAD